MKRISSLFNAVLLIFIFYALPLLAQGTGATQAPDHLILTWTGNPSTTQTITWRTDTTVQMGIVQYRIGTSHSGKIQTKKATLSVFTTDLGVSHLFTATLTGLVPGKTYSYRVGNGKNWSSVHTFFTENLKTDQFKFLIFGDSQSGSSDLIYKPWSVTLHNAYQANKDAKFLINMGDLVERGQESAHWNSWFDAAKGVIDTIPEMSVQGNHETYPWKKTPTRKPIYWLAQFNLPQNGPQGLKNQVYSYDYGPVHFVVLDSQEVEEKPGCGDILEAQKAWLEKDLASSKAVWKIALFHKPPYDLKIACSNPEIKKAFCPIFDKYHVDLVFNAHDHGVSRTFPIKNDTLESKPSQGTIYCIVGRSGSKCYRDLIPKYWNTFLYDPQDQPNYLTVQISGKRLTINAVKQDGTLISVFTIDKSKDTDSDTKIYALPSTSWAKFSSPVLAVYGSLVDPDICRHVPMQKNGIWYVDANAFAGSVGDLISTNGSRVTVQEDDTLTDIPSNDLMTDDNTLLFSSDALKTLGYSVQFHPENNILNVAR